jgi:transposase InsO family protein
MSLVSDNDCQLTSQAFIKSCSPLGMQQACTRSNHSKGYGETERVRRTLNEACLWLHE